MEVIVEKKPETITIPKYLVYEVLDGQPIPYRGFEEVLNKEKTLEDIRGSSGLQSVIVTDIFYIQTLSGKPLRSIKQRSRATSK